MQKHYKSPACLPYDIHYTDVVAMLVLQARSDYLVRIRHRRSKHLGQGSTAQVLKSILQHQWHTTTTGLK